MANDRRRSHALLSQLGGEQGAPFLPEVGQLYLVRTIIYGYDPAADRRAVVICVPSVPHSPVRIVTRTSQQTAPGVPHPADLALQCDLDGVFSNPASVEQQLWRPENVKLLGVLTDLYLTKVLERFS
jgi:hypothetical protein